MTNEERQQVRLETLSEVSSVYSKCGSDLFFNNRWQKILKSSEEMPEDYKKIIKQKLDGFEWCLHEMNRTFYMWLSSEMRKKNEPQLRN